MCLIQSAKKQKNLTDLFLQALTHSTVQIIAGAKELQEVMLRAK